MWNDIGYIISSEKRKCIIKLLYTTPSTPKSIADKCDVTINNVSNILGDLVKKGFIICLTPERKKGRIYSLSKLGITVVDKINGHLTE